MRFAACQTPELLGDVDAALAVVHEFARRSDADLLLFPECFLQGYLVTPEHVAAQAFDVDGPEFAAVLAALTPVRQTLVLGLIERAGAAYHNTALVIRNGAVLGRYRKTFLVPGESVFTPGDDYPVFDCGGVRFGINICYDTRFPEAAAAVAAGGAEVLLIASQNMMRREKAPRWQPRHNGIRAERARETGLWLMSADVTGTRGGTHIGLGPTAVIDPSGRVVAQVPTGTTGTVVFDPTGHDEGA